MPKTAPTLERPPRDLHGTSTLFVRDLSPDDHAIFKSKCAARGRTMRGLIIAFMRDVNGGSASRGVIDLGKLSRAYPANADNPK